MSLEKSLTKPKKKCSMHIGIVCASWK